MRLLPTILLLTAALQAQTQVPRDQCLGGTLLSAQPNSVTLKFNAKTTTYPLAPNAEIWRRGVDLASPLDLVAGEEIYLECTRETGLGSGPVLANIVAAVEKNEDVLLQPHHIVETGVCGGRLLTATKETLTLRNDQGTCLLHTGPGTHIWRGETVPDPTALQPGDDVIARYTVTYPDRLLTAEEIEANVAKAEGRVTSVRPDRILIKDGRHSVTALLDTHTVFDPNSEAVHKGATVLAIGLDLGHNTFRATTVTVEK
jgi:hypothetical protein